MERQVNAFLASIESQSDYSASTRLAYASDLRVFMDYLTTSLQRPPQLEDLTPEHLALFLQAEGNSGKRQSTLVRRRATLRSFTRYLTRHGDLPGGAPAIDAVQVERAIAAVPVLPVLQCLTEAQVASVLVAIETSPRPRARRDQAILLLMLETGLSVGALVRLDLADLDLRQGFVYVPGENGKSNRIPVGTAALALGGYLQEGRPELNHQPDEKALFISQMDGRISRQGLWQILRHWGRKAKPPIDLSPRLVRNTTALRMLRSGKTVVEIQARLGHDNILSTQALIRRLEAACQDGNPTTLDIPEETTLHG
jgi:site-specific recombinase XerD